jgi:hypothetical protein
LFPFILFVWHKGVIVLYSVFILCFDVISCGLFYFLLIKTKHTFGGRMAFFCVLLAIFFLLLSKGKRSCWAFLKMKTLFITWSMNTPGCICRAWFLFLLVFTELSRILVRRSKCYERRTIPLFWWNNRSYNIHLDHFKNIFIFLSQILYFFQVWLRGILMDIPEKLYPEF